MSYIRYNNSNIEIVGADNMHPISKYESGREVKYCSEGEYGMNYQYDGKYDGSYGRKPEVKADTKVACVDVDPVNTESCVNNPVTIAALGRGAVAKVPVVLAQLRVQANVNTVITLPEFAFEIKDIKKRLKITQCLLLQDTNVLFIKGFIRKNIDYSTRSCSTPEGFCGDIRHCTVDVPFTCTTPVTFNGTAPAEPIASTRTEFEYLKREGIFHPDFSEKDELVSGDLREHNQVSTEFFNELPFCDIVSARIVEFDEQLMPVYPKGIVAPFEEKKFRRIEEKMVVFITLRLLQNRLVAVPAVAGAAEDKCEE